MKAKPPKTDPVAVQSELWQNLPFELVLLTLESLVQQNPERAYQIVLVSRAVQRCIDPFLYEVVTLWTSKAIVLFAWTICQPDRINKPPSFFRDHVKSVCFMGKDDTAVSLIISRCRQIHTLSFLYGYSDLESCKHLPLHRLSVHFQPKSAIFDSPKTLFPSLTHLELYVLLWDDLQIPGCLQLTHLSVILLTNVGLSPASELTFPPSLKVIIAGTRFIETVCLEGRCHHDIRFVYRFSKLPPGAENVDHIIIRSAFDEDLASDWGRTPVGELDIWEMAEDVVTKRREALRLKEQHDA